MDSIKGSLHFLHLREQVKSDLRTVASERESNEQSRVKMLKKKTFLDLSFAPRILKRGTCVMEDSRRTSMTC